MSTLFLQLFNMSITAGWLAVALILLRPLLKRMQKGFLCALWGLVGLRLLLPFSVETAFSLIPSAETVPQEILYAKEPAIHSGIPALNSVLNPFLGESLAPTVGNSANPMQIITQFAAILWCIGMVGMAGYACISFLRVRRKTRIKIEFEPKVYLCDGIDTPFILGVFRPSIYLPSSMDEADIPMVLAHERAHLKRKDHWWKPLGFALLTV
ncbi:MAG: transcriptional regulator, partial [Clostridia bacterium]|nr:transcriptional regulator [Clostridia bacterium]